MDERHCPHRPEEYDDEDPIIRIAGHPSLDELLGSDDEPTPDADAELFEDE